MSLGETEHRHRHGTAGDIIDSRKELVLRLRIRLDLI